MAYRNILFSSSVLSLLFVALNKSLPTSFLTMEFKKLHSGTTCKCIDGECKINTDEFFYRRFFGENATKEDFESWEEMGKKHRVPAPNCDEVCSFRSLSITKHVDEVNIEEFYKTTIKLKPNTEYETPFYCKMKFTDKCGKLKPSKSKKDANHHSFFKSDEFDFTKLSLEIKPMPK